MGITVVPRRKDEFSSTMKGISSQIVSYMKMTNKAKADDAAAMDKMNAAAVAVNDSAKKTSIDIVGKQGELEEKIRNSKSKDEFNSNTADYNNYQEQAQIMLNDAKFNTPEAISDINRLDLSPKEGLYEASIKDKDGVATKMNLPTSIQDIEEELFVGKDGNLYQQGYNSDGMKEDGISGKLNIKSREFNSTEAALIAYDSKGKEVYFNTESDRNKAMFAGVVTKNKPDKEGGASSLGTKISDMPEIEQKIFLDLGYEITDHVSKVTRDSYTKKGSSGSADNMKTAWKAYKTRTGKDIPLEQFKLDHWNIKEGRPYESTKEKVTAKATLVSDIVKHSKAVVSGKKKYNYDEASQNQAILEEVGLTGAVKKVQEKFITSRDNLPSLDRLKKAIETDMDNGVYSDSQYTSAIKKFVTRYTPKEWGILSTADRLNAIDALENEGAIGVETAAYLKENSGTAASAQEALRTFKNMVGGNAIISIDVRKANLDIYIKNKKKKTADYARSAYNMGMQRDAGEYLFGDKEVKKKEPEYLYKTIGGKKKRAKNPKYKG